MIWSVAGLLLPVGATWLMLRALRLRSPAASPALAAAIAVCVGLGASSLLAFWWAVAFGGIGRTFAAVEAVIWVTVAVIGWRRSRSRPPAGNTVAPAPTTAARRFVVGVFVLLAGITAAVAVVEHVASPSGHPDATLIWNLKARFMIRGGEEWRAFVQVPWSSPSHPLLVSASVARLWAYAGSEVISAPVILDALVAASIVAALIGTLGAHRTRAWLAACVLIAPWTFSQAIAAQTADLPVALYLLVTVVMLMQIASPTSQLPDSGLEVRGTSPAPPAETRGHPRWDPGFGPWGLGFVSGLLASLAAWTKNEGVVVFALALGWVAWTAVRQSRGRQLVAFIAGAAPALLTIAWLKTVLAPMPPEYFGGGGPTAVGSVDWARLEVVARLAWQHWIRWGSDAGVGLLPAMTLAALAVAAFAPAGIVARRVLLVAGVLFAAYCAVWVLSPLDTTWLVTTTADRLLLQLWPSVVLAAFSAPLRGLPAAGNLER